VEYIGKTVPSFKGTVANALIPELDANTQMRFSLLKDARRQIAQENNINQNFNVCSTTKNWKTLLRCLK
jgi:hypothetical protein